MKIVDPTTPVTVVTGSSDALLHGVIGILRSLGRLGVPVHLVQGVAGTPVERSRYLKQTHTVPIDLDAPGEYLQRILEIGRMIGRRSILVPVDDVTSLFVAEHAEALRESFCFPEQPPGLARMLANKKDLYLLCRRLGIPAPATEFPKSRDDVAALADRTRFPVVMKAMDPVLLRLRPQARSVVIVRGRDELLEAYDQMELGGLPNLMLQEYLPGGADTVWMFNGYFNEHGDCLASFTGTKLRQYPPSTGATCLGVCRRNPSIERVTRDLLKSVGYHGIVDMGYRFDARSGQYMLLDVNPRIGATFRLFVAQNGMDVARAMYLDLTGQPVPEAPPSEGRKWFVEHLDLLTSSTEYRSGELSIADWAHSLRGVREAAWFAWNDLGPFLVVSRRLIGSALRRAPRRLSGGLWGGLPGPGRSGPGRIIGPISPRHSDDVIRAVAEPTGGDRKAPRQLVDARFDAEASYWRDVYRGEDVQSAIYQYRQALALDWIDQLDLRPGSQVLEVGCGAGVLSVLLARRGLQVRAVDTATAMLRLTAEHAAGTGLTSQVQVTSADVHLLPYRAGTFSLVVALGVLPWLHSPRLAMQEMAQVLRPGGHILVSIDNRRRLTHLVDPLLSPPLQPLRTATKGVLSGLGLWSRTEPPTEPVARPTMHDPEELQDLITAVGLRPVEHRTFGFGPFTLFGRELLHGKPGLRWNRTLQRLADRNLAGLGCSGAQCLVMAERPAT